MENKESDSQKRKPVSLESQRIEAGLLGRIFGTGDSAIRNVIGLVVILLVMGGLATTLLGNQNYPAIEYWRTATPLITGALSYLAGCSISRARNTRNPG